MALKSIRLGLDTKVNTAVNAPEGRYFGVELEMENFTGVGRDYHSCWNLKHEGSLRKGVEFVTNPAQSYVGRKDVLAELPKAIAKLSSTALETSIRCSTHIHINVGDLTIRQVITAALLYYLFENPLVKTQHRFRQGNLFCLRMIDAKYITEMLYAVTKSPSCWGREFSQSAAKYSALNLGNVFRIGTIEFRFLSPITEPQELNFWIEVFQSIVEFAQRNSAADLIKMYDELSLKEFMSMIWDKNAHELYERFMQGINTTMLNRAIHKNYDSIVEIAHRLGRKKFELPEKYWDPDDTSGAAVPEPGLVFDDFDEPDESPTSWPEELPIGI